MQVTIGWARPPWNGTGVGLLDPKELARADTLVRVGDRYRFIAAHALLRLLVAELTGTDPARLELISQCPVCGAHDHGRPGFPADASVRLSLSRSGHRVVVAVAQGNAHIGIDVEPLGTTWLDETAFDAVALTPKEHAWVMARPERERAAARTAVWVRKEAVLKRAGVGLTVPPAEFDLAASGDVLTDVNVGAGYQCALATAGPVRVSVADATARLASLATRA